MANQVASMQPSGNFGMDVFPSNVNFGFMPTKVLPNVDVQYSSAFTKCLCSIKHCFTKLCWSFFWRFLCASWSISYIVTGSM